MLLILNEETNISQERSDVYLGHGFVPRFGGLILHWPASGENMGFEHIGLDIIRSTGAEGKRTSVLVRTYAIRPANLPINSRLDQDYVLFTVSRRGEEQLKSADSWRCFHLSGTIYICIVYVGNVAVFGFFDDSEANSCRISNPS